jgi:phage regulator Rha-like protein
VFNKRHVDVLRDIKNLHCSEEFHKRNFALMVEMK